MDENIPNDSEISPKEIIRQMKLNFFKNYPTNNNPLINIDYLLYRPSIFALIHNISNRIGFKSQTFFLSIYYLDILHLKNKKIDLDLKTISLACLLLASKYTENDQNVPVLPAFVAVFNSIVDYKDFISNKELLFAEVLICKLLEYKLNYYTIYDFDSFFFGHGIIKIEQLREINNNGINPSKNDFNEINMDISENSIYIRKILEKIYRKSRYYLDNIINNGNICLKYSSLIISVVIMKKSVEDILIKEQKIQEFELEDFKEKTSNCFKEIMKEIYQIDYESMEEYQNLIKENELQNIFKANNKRNSYYIKDSNMKILSNNQNRNNLNLNNRYTNNLNKTINENIFIKKFNFSQNIDRYNYKKRNQSRIEDSEGKFLYPEQYKKERISVPRRYNLNEKYNYLSNFNSSFTKSINISKNISLSKNKENIEKNKTKDISLRGNSQINNISNYIHTYTNQFYQKKTKGSNSINKAIIKNTKNINVNDFYDDSKNFLNIMDNNQSISNEKNILNTEVASKERNYEKYTKLVLRKRFFNRINRANDYSLSQLDDSNIFQNIIPSNEKNSNKISQKPYFKKVIKNITNYTIKPKSKFNSFYSTMNNNMYNPIRKKQNKLIILNPFPLIQKASKETILNNELNIDNENNIDNKIKTEKKKNFDSETTKNISNRKNILDKNSLITKKFLLNHKRKIFSNNILFNSMTIENGINNDIKDEKNEILLTANNDYISQNNERQKLLFMRMRNINNKLNFKNSLNNTEIKTHFNGNENTTFKRKFVIPNNIKKEIMNISIKEIPENNNKDKIYENQIDNKNTNNNKRYINKNTTFVIKELQTKNIRNKLLNNKKTEIKNIQIKNEKINFPKTSIFKLINRTKTLNTNKLDLSKEERNSDLINKFIIRNTNNIPRYKNMHTLDLNIQENNINESNNIQKMIFNTIDNNNPNDKKDIKNSAIHGYHHRNYMKNKIKKENETDISKVKNKNMNNNNNSNNNSKTIVINNNININFNNKIDHSNTYNIKKNENINKQIKTKINDNEEFLNKIINKRNNNINSNYYPIKGTNEYNNVNKKISHNNLSSLVHRIPFYKKNLRNNKNDLTRGNSKEITSDNY